MDLIDRFDQKLWTSGDANTVEGGYIMKTCKFPIVSR